MATPSSTTQRTLLEEAADPTASLERLCELAQYSDYVRCVVYQNPSLPEDTWREVLLDGYPEAWANPMAPFYLTVWEPRQSDWRTLEGAAQGAVYGLWTEPDRCSLEGKALLAIKIQEWWNDCESSQSMMYHLDGWARAKENGSPEHRKVTHVLVQCVRTFPQLSPEDQSVLTMIESWAMGGNDLHPDVKQMASSSAVRHIIDFIRSQINESFGIVRHLTAIEDRSSNEARQEESRRLADLIRQEMPSAPVPE